MAIDKFTVGNLYRFKKEFQSQKKDRQLRLFKTWRRCVEVIDGRPNFEGIMHISAGFYLQYLMPYLEELSPKQVLQEIIED